MKKDDAWRLAIRQTIGGSAAGTALGKGRFKTARDLWREMVDARNGIAPADIDNESMRAGRLLEPVALGLLRESVSEPVEPYPQDALAMRDDCPWAHTLPDGLVGRDGIAEVKAVYPSVAMRVQRDGLFPDWLIQAQHNMHIARKGFCDFGVLDRFALVLCRVRIEYDAVFAALIMQHEAAFMELVKGGIPPELDADPNPLPVDDDAGGEVVTITDPVVAQIAAHHLRLRELRDDVDEALAQSQRDLAIAVGCNVDGNKLIGGPAAFEIPGVVKVVHRELPGAMRFDVALAAKKYPELATDKFKTRGAASRPWRVYSKQRKDT